MTNISYRTNIITKDILKQIKKKRIFLRKMIPGNNRGFVKFYFQRPTSIMLNFFERKNRSNIMDFFE